MQRSESINELAGALAKAQGQIQNAAKDTANPFFKSKYADLASCWDACRKPLSDNSLCIIQLPTTQGSLVTVETILLHSSGQWISEFLTVLCKDESPQAIGSGTTYARRYGLCPMVGIAPEDDDGNAGSGRGTIESARQATQDQDIPPELKPIFTAIRKDRGKIPDAMQMITREMERFEGGAEYCAQVIQKFGTKYPQGAPTASYEKLLLHLWESRANMKELVKAE